MESTGARQKVQISSSTGKLLIAAGKEHWLKAREDTVFAKGKGVLNTYWANPTSKRGSSVASDQHSQTSSTGQDSGQNGLHALKINETVLVNNRYVDWMVDLLMDDIKKVVSVNMIVAGSFAAQRNHLSNTDQMVASPKQVHGKRTCDIADNTTIDLFFQAKKGVTCLDEMKDCIPMPILNACAANSMGNAKDIHVEQSLLDSMRELVNAIAMRYNDNPFHNVSCHKKHFGFMLPPLSFHSAESSPPDFRLHSLMLVFTV